MNRRGAESAEGNRLCKLRKLRALGLVVRVTAIRCNATLRAFYRRPLAAGKAPKVALIAAMRKLLTAANAMLRDGATWTPPSLNS